MDEDKNGWADREEMRLLPMFCGLEALIRKEVSASLPRTLPLTLGPNSWR